MSQYTKKLTINGWVNLLTALTAAGYSGHGVIKNVSIYNISGSVTLYIHRGSVNNTGLTGADGYPILNGEKKWDKIYAAQVMLHTASSIVIKIDFDG